MIEMLDTFIISMSIQAYTDGSCKPNPGPGGWAWVWFSTLEDSVVFCDSGGSKNTTNNRMELLAVIKLFKDLRDIEILRVDIYTDSQYVLKGLVSAKGGILRFSDKPEYTGYAKRWNLPTKTRINADLWNKLHSELIKWSSKNTEVYLHWVKGHSGDPGNDLVDKLAQDAVPNI